MAVRIAMPAIALEADATPSVSQTLGFGRAVQSRLTVGRSDALIVDADHVIADEALAEHLKRQADECVLVRLSLRMSFRPAADERFDRALFTVTLKTDDPGTEDQPFARVLAPDRLTSGTYTLARGVVLGLHAGVPGAELSAESSSTKTTELQPPYVYAAGVGESDPEWRYERTETMQLLGSHEMALIAEVRRGVAAHADIAADASVAAGRHRTEVAWTPQEGIGRVSLPSS
jgi:hypothetical protein